MDVRVQPWAPEAFLLRGGWHRLWTYGEILSVVTSLLHQRCLAFWRKAACKNMVSNLAKMQRCDLPMQRCVERVGVGSILLSTQLRAKHQNYSNLSHPWITSCHKNSAFGFFWLLIENMPWCKVSQQNCEKGDDLVGSKRAVKSSWMYGK